MFALWKTSLIGEPWEPWMDNEVWEDWSYGCSVFTIAKRCRRTEAEIEARLKHLGLNMAEQPKRKIRRTDWTRR